MALEIGSKAPDFSSISNGDKLISLSDYLGKWVVLYFYPKDDTSGCTKEACSFRDNLSQLTELGVEVLGVSPDSAKSHDKFVEKYNLNFHLVADSDKKICESFNILGEKSMYGKKYIGVIRTTYLIDNEGKFQYVWSNVKVDGHVEAVVNKIKELKD
jgi:peroxiredoxin Q/BCP